MTYPINEQEFVKSWLEVLNAPDEGDVALAEEGIRIGINLAKKENKIP